MNIWGKKGLIARFYRWTLYERANSLQTSYAVMAQQVQEMKEQMAAIEERRQTVERQILALDGQ